MQAAMFLWWHFLLKCQWETYPSRLRHFQVIQMWSTGSGCYRQLLFVMLIEEICQLKSCYFCKSACDNLYSCADLIHACHHFSGRFSVAVFCGSCTQRWRPHSHILTTPPTKLWLTQLFFQPWQQASVRTTPDVFEWLKKNQRYVHQFRGLELG